MMTHLSDEVISDLIDRRAEAGVEASALAHFGECEECRDISHRVASVVSLAPDLRRPAYPRRELWPGIAAATVGSRRRRLFAFVVIAMIAVMAALLAVAFSVGRLPFREQGRLAVVALPQAEASKVASALKEIGRVHSDNDKRVELARISRSVLRRYDSQVQRDFFAAANTIGSDGARRKLILSIAGVESQDMQLTRMMITFASSIQSSLEKMTALTELANDRLIKTQPLRDQFLGAAAAIVSPVHRNRTIAALNGR